jgi:hypothetical protein
MIYITEVRMAKDGRGHEHIDAVRWERADSPETGESTREEMIGWIGRKQDGLAYVRDKKGHKPVAVIVVRPEHIRPHLRTTPDGKELKDDLLDLPRYGVLPGEVA